MVARATCQALPSGAGRRNDIPEANLGLFQGWQVNPNSIFGESARLGRPAREADHGCPVLLSTRKVGTYENVLAATICYERTRIAL